MELPKLPPPRRFVIIGGGIAGITAAEEVLSLVPEGSVHITLLTATKVIKQVGKVIQVTRKLEEVEVVERDADDYVGERRNIEVIQARVIIIDVAAHRVECEGAVSFAFDRCMICTGAAPKLISSHPHVVGIRDTESIQDLSHRLHSARRVMVIGNGGIALEIVHEVIGCELIWAIKDSYVGNTFFDHTASGFVLPELKKRREVHVLQKEMQSSPALQGDWSPRKRPRAEIGREGRRAEKGDKAAVLVVAEGRGGALGPDWKHNLGREKREEEQKEKGGTSQPVNIIFNAELEELIEPSSSSSSSAIAAAAIDEKGEGFPRVEGEEEEEKDEEEKEEDWPLYVRLTNGQTSGCDFVVSATGVVPIVDFLGPEFERGEDGGVIVNDKMQTTASPDIYAAGDCCSMTWPESDVWFQMRLWTQARSMAVYAAKCMADQVDDLGSGFAFELFAHMTHFFGFKVALLGCFNAQLLPDDAQRRLVQEVMVVVSPEGEEGEMEIRRPDGSTAPSSSIAPSLSTSNGVEILTRLTPGVEYIKVVVVEGKVKGAMMVGEGTEMAETFENLILNQIDVSRYGVDLLNPDIDVDDYFD